MATVSDDDNETDAYVLRKVGRLINDVDRSFIDMQSHRTAVLIPTTVAAKAGVPVLVPPFMDVLCAVCAIPDGDGAAGAGNAAASPVSPVLHLRKGWEETLTALPQLPYPKFVCLTDTVHRRTLTTFGEIASSAWSEAMFGAPPPPKPLPVPNTFPGIPPVFHWAQLQSQDLLLNCVKDVSVTLPWNGHVVFLTALVERTDLPYDPENPLALLPYKLKPEYVPEHHAALHRVIGGVPVTCLTPGTVINMSGASCFGVREALMWRALPDDKASKSTFVLRLNGEEAARITPQVTACVKAGAFGSFNPETSVCSVVLGRCNMTMFDSLSFVAE